MVKLREEQTRERSERRDVEEKAKEIEDLLRSERHKVEAEQIECANLES